MRINIIGLLLLFAANTAFSATLYRWVDKNGVVNYGDQVPNSGVQQLEQKKLQSNVIDGQSSYVLKEAVSKHPVILFAGDCGPVCTDAQTLLNKRGIPYALKDPQKNRADAVALHALMGGGAMALPVLKVGDDIIRGFEASRWNAALDEAGYPKSPLPGDVKAVPARLTK